MALLNSDRDVMVALSYSESPQDEPVGILLSDVQPKPIRWSWPGRLALGKLEMFDGPPDLGKTTLMFDIIARLTRGRPMPDQPAPGMMGGAVLICLEDDIEDTIQPKLAKAGANLSKIVSIGYRPVKNDDGSEYHKPFCLAEDLNVLEAAIKRVDAKLIFIDPIMMILGGKDTYKDNEVRATLAPLKALAERYEVTVVCIRHTTKSSSNEKLIYQGIGSIGFIGLARIGLMAMANPDNENQGIFFTPKNNLVKKELRTKLLYTIVSDENDPDRPYVRWDGITTITEQEMTSRPQDNQGGNRTAILKCLQESFPDPMSPQQIADELALDLNVVTVTLKRMYDAEQINKQGRGQYVAIK
jgi:putative DNA primase/helicase